MVYKYVLYGMVPNTERTVSCHVSNPNGITREELIERIATFSKAVTLSKVDVLA